VIASEAFRALGTTAVIAAAEPAALPEARRILEAELKAFDDACSRFRPDSELSELNRLSGEWVEVGPLLFLAVEIALAVAERTGGLVDPTVGANLRDAGYDRTFAEVLLRDGTRFRPSFQPVAGWRCVELDADRRAIRVPPRVELDLGATAKALAADRAAGAASVSVRSGVLVSLGGDVAVADTAPPGGWPVRIADDHATPLDGPGPVVSISAGGLASSGTRVRRWTSSGGELHHIIDPRTGRPAATSWHTVSVAAPTCVDANAASTAAIVLGNAGADWLVDARLPARLAAVDGTVSTVNGWPTEAVP
jgi:thiamine biosynthesis lipoprotein